MKCVPEQIFVVCSLRTDFMELAADSFSYCLIFTHILYIKHFNEKWALARRLVNFWWDCQRGWRSVNNVASVWRALPTTLGSWELVRSEVFSPPTNQREVSWWCYFKVLMHQNGPLPSSRANGQSFAVRPAVRCFVINERLHSKLS